MVLIFILSVFIGWFVVRGVTPVLYSPLMSVTNAISGIIIIGAIHVAGLTENKIVLFFATAAIIFSAINVFGGFTVSARMLSMFKPKEKKK